jgi:hypothetical protein
VPACTTNLTDRSLSTVIFKSVLGESGFLVGDTNQNTAMERPQKSVPSDAEYDLTAFVPSSTSDDTRKLNKHLISATQKDQKWWEVGAATLPNNISLCIEMIFAGSSIHEDPTARRTLLTGQRLERTNIARCERPERQFSQPTLCSLMHVLPWTFHLGKRGDPFYVESSSPRS